MKLSKRLFLIVILFFITASCILPSRVYNMFYPILSNFPGLAEEEPEKDGGDDSIPLSIQPKQGWNCSASDLSSYLGDKWQPYQNLDLKLYSSEDIMTYTINFRTESKFLVKRDPDYHPPPGATLVPEGEYKLEERYLGFGEIILNDGLYLGTTNVDYTITTHFPEPVVNEGKIGYRTVGHFVSDSVLELCLDVYEGGYQDAINAPFTHLAPNCRFPGYIFSCTPEP